MSGFAELILPFICTLCLPSNTPILTRKLSPFRMAAPLSKMLIVYVVPFLCVFSFLECFSCKFMACNNLLHIIFACFVVSNLVSFRKPFLRSNGRLGFLANIKQYDETPVWFHAACSYMFRREQKVIYTPTNVLSMLMLVRLKQALAHPILNWMIRCCSGLPHSHQRTKFFYDVAYEASALVRVDPLRNLRAV